MLDIFGSQWGSFRGLMDPHIRMTALILLVLCIAALTATIIIRRNKATRRVRRITLWVFLFLCICCYGIADNIQDDIRVSITSYLSAACFLGMLLSMIWHPQGDNRLPNEDGAVGSRFIIWLDRQVRRYKAEHPAGRGTL